MVRGGKVGCKSDFRKRGRLKDKGSDDSDEDYVVSDEENEESNGDSKDYFSSLDECASEESLASFAEEYEEEAKEARKVVRPKKKKAFSTKKEFGNKRSQKRRRLFIKEEEDEDYDEDYAVEEEEGEDNDTDYEDDEEFTPDEDVSLDEEEEELASTRKKSKPNGSKQGFCKSGSSRGLKKRINSALPKAPVQKRNRKKRGLRRKMKFIDDDEDCDYDDDDDFVGNISGVRKNDKMNAGRRKRRHVVESDSDIVSSGSSDYEYTISEEEREQIREAREFTMRSSLPTKRIHEVQDKGEVKKHPGRKGKEKVEEVKTEVVKQVCGICLSEEDKRRFRGTLDCCSHYFCFTCIMEWSKVESRCPICKQRFKTVSKPARATAGVDLREVVIQVPERDQVYQPSEEELRSYLDPYENVICSECHQGGDDGLMLLCDLCDSSAHTYCVGLGQEVPDGNWYCEGCRPVALGSPILQAQDSFPDQRTINNSFYNRPSPIAQLGESVHSPIISSPHTPFTQGFGGLSSPRFSGGDGPAGSLVTGAGAPTLSGRRWRARQIQQHILSTNRMNLLVGRTDGVSGANLSNVFLNSQIDLSRDTTIQQSRASLPTIFEERLQDDPSSSVQSRDFFTSRLGLPRMQAVQDPGVSDADVTVNLTLWPERAGINFLSGNEQLRHFSNRPNGGTNCDVAPLRDENDSSMAKEQLQSMVKSHLKNLSRDIELGHNTFKDIAGSSVHTILAACGLDHRRNEVQTVPLPSTCTHIERVAAGQTSLMKGCCSTCFDSFVKDVVKRIMDTSVPQWLSLGL